MLSWSNVVTDVEELFSEAEQDALAFLTAAAKAIASSGGQLLILAATQAVQTAESTGGDNATKLAAATTSVVGTLESQGITVALNAVNAGVEAAVAQMRANQAQPAAPAPAPGA